MEHPPCCGNTNLEALFKKKFKSSDFKSKSIPSSSVVVKKLPNNPYLSSITGKYAFDLSKISNFSLYFWKSTDDPSINDAVQFILTDFATSPAINWSTYYQSQTLNTFSQFASFVNKTSSITTSYADSDVVCVLADSPDILGACFGPEFIYLYPTFVDNKVVLFLSNTDTTNDNIKEGGEQYLTLIHEFGHGFGLAHPHDNGFGSTIMPGIGDITCEDGTCIGTSIRYPGIAGNINNSVFNSVMTYNDMNFFLPIDRDFSTSKIGYAQTLMPLDASALRWMYNLSSVSDAYVAKYGVKVINPAVDQQNTQMIVGKNRELTFGSNCQDINFYFSNNFFKFNNLQPVKYQYNRIIEKPYTFYPQDLCSTVAILNFRNTGTSNIFIEKNALKTNLKVNCISNTVLNVYIIDLKNNYKINGTTYKDKKTGKKMSIVNTSGATINVYFNK
jgi:hypothetical protein